MHFAEIRELPYIVCSCVRIIVGTQAFSGQAGAKLLAQSKIFFFFFSGNVSTTTWIKRIWEIAVMPQIHGKSDGKIAS